MSRMWTTKRQLREQIAALEAELERQGQVKTTMALISANQDPSDEKAFLLKLHSDVWPLIAHALATWFYSTGAENYVEQHVGIPRLEDDTDRKASLSFTVSSLWNRDRTKLSPKFDEFTIVMQRKGGLTPDQKLKQAVDDLHATVLDCAACLYPTGTP